MKKREATVTRKTKETDIKLTLNLDGQGKGKIKTGIGFFDHMLELWTKHGSFDLTLSAKGDLHVDYHHTVEDIGICMGNAVKKILKDKRGINRFGESTLPMDEALVLTSLDISGRSYLSYNIKTRYKKIVDFPIGLIEEFLRAFSNNAGITIHIMSFSGKDPHHIIEAVFKSFGRALSSATSTNPKSKSIPSTKGIL